MPCHDLEMLIEWFKGNQLSLKISKTVLMHFRELKDHTPLVVNNIEIPSSDSTKFLGVHIDKELKWTTHINYLHKKKIMANKFLLSANTNLLDTTSLCSIYQAHIFSHLSYGLLVWGTMASKKAIKDLTSIEDSCVCLLSKHGKNANVILLYKKHNHIRLPDMIKIELAKYGHRLTNKNYPNSLQSIANAIRGMKTIDTQLAQKALQIYKPTAQNNSTIVICARESQHTMQFQHKLRNV